MTQSFQMSKTFMGTIRSRYFVPKSLASFRLSGVSGTQKNLRALLRCCGLGSLAELQSFVAFQRYRPVDQGFLQSDLWVVCKKQRHQKKHIIIYQYLPSGKLT